MVLFPQKVNAKTLIIMVVCIAAIVIAVFFHHGVYFVDALTGDKIKDISVSISPWRVFFEPVFGPLMFALRGHDPIVEFVILLFWVLGVLLIIRLVKNMREKSGSIFRRLVSAFFHWLANVPMVLISWIALLLLMIFAPLPTNTITCSRDDTALVNFHSHSFYSHDGLISQENLTKWHKRNGFDAFFITDHNHHKKTLEFIAKRESSQLGVDEICVMPGQEYSGSNHLLLLGLTHDFSTKDMPDSVAVDTIHAQGGVVIVAHWFADERRSIQYYIDCGVDGFEIANQGEGIDYDRRIFQDIVSACRKNKLLMMGDTDYHGYGNACYVWNALNIPGWDDFSHLKKKNAILSILRNKQSEKIQVVTYCDRRFLDPNLLWSSPIPNAVDYIRSLNIWQILSWLVWVVGLQFVFKHQSIHLFRRWLKSRPFRKSSILGLFSGIFVFIVGINHLFMASQLKGYNNIFNENGTFLVIGGGIFVIYSIILLLIKPRK